jgi:hypothetical protein
MFYAPELVSAVPWASVPIFMFCVPKLIFNGTEGVRFRFNILRFQTRFLRYRVCQVQFSCFAFSDSFSVVPSASRLVFMFCTPGLIFGGSEGIRSRFNVFRSRTCFWRRGGRQVPFSFFALPVTFSAVFRASGPVFIFCTSELVFGNIEGVETRFHVLRCRSCFPRYRGHPMPFSYFPLPDMFSAVPRASSPIFTFCSPILVFGGIEGVRSRFHVLRSLTHFQRCRVRRVSF